MTIPRIVGFESPYPVAVSQAGPTEWELTAAMTYHGRTHTITVPAGQSTDFASVPSVLTWLVPIETGIPAAVLHDHLWRALVPAGHLTYRDADRVLREALGGLGVSAARCWLMWTAVRWGALFRPGGWRGWWRDAPTVIAVTLVGLPVAAPALLLVPSLVVFRVVEVVGRVRLR